MSTQITKRQHFVPQFYLRKFSPDKKRINTYEKTTRSVQFYRIREVAQEHFFYDIPADSLPLAQRDVTTIQVAETAFSKLENDFSTILNEFLALGSSDVISANQRQRMALFLSFQFVRTRDFRNYVLELDRKIIQLALDQIMEKKFPGNEELTPLIQDRERSVAMTQNRHIFDLRRAAERANKLQKHIWLVGVNPPGELNFTSDSPIVIRNATGTSGLADGFARRGAEVIFPLSPERSLILRERTHFNADSPKDGRQIALDPDEVEGLNQLQVIHSESQIFSINNDFSLIGDMLMSDPQLFDPSRERVIIDERDPAIQNWRKAIDEQLNKMSENSDD